MSTSTKASTPPPVKRARRPRPLLFPLTFIGIGVFVALLFGYLQATIVRGTEFDTGSWSVRTFWYRRDPFSGWQLTGILREQPASLTNTAAFPNSYFTGANSTPARWDLVNLRSGAALTEGPANVLNSYFDRYLGEQIWLTWSSENTIKANTLWPAVRDLVDLALYHELPRVMELATVDSTDAEFKIMVDEEMHAILEENAEKFRVEEKADELSVVTTLLSKYATNN